MEKSYNSRNVNNLKILNIVNSLYSIKVSKKNDEQKGTTNNVTILITCLNVFFVSIGLNFRFIIESRKHDINLNFWQKPTYYVW